MDKDFLRGIGKEIHFLSQQPEHINATKQILEREWNYLDTEHRLLSTLIDLRKSTIIDRFGLNFDLYISGALLTHLIIRRYHEWSDAHTSYEDLTPAINDKYHAYIMRNLGNTRPSKQLRKLYSTLTRDIARDEPDLYELLTNGEKENRPPLEYILGIADVLIPYKYSLLQNQK